LKRKRIKKLIHDLAEEIPMIRDNMLAALGRVIPSHLMDSKLFDFKKLGTAGDDRNESCGQ